MPLGYRCLGVPIATTFDRFSSFTFWVSNSLACREARQGLGELDRLPSHNDISHTTVLLFQSESSVTAHSVGRCGLTAYPTSMAIVPEIVLLLFALHSQGVICE